MFSKAYKPKPTMKEIKRTLKELKCELYETCKKVIKSKKGKIFTKEWTCVFEISRWMPQASMKIAFSNTWLEW